VLNFCTNIIRQIGFTSSLELLNYHTPGEGNGNDVPGTENPGTIVVPNIEQASGSGDIWPGTPAKSGSKGDAI